MSAALILPAILDLRAAAPLHAELQTRAGAPLALDAANVERIGGLCLQVLIAAAAAWGAAGHAFEVVHATQSFCDDVRRMGAAELIPGSAVSC